MATALGRRCGVGRHRWRGGRRRGAPSCVDHCCRRAAIPGAAPNAGSGDAVPAAATGPTLAVLPFENIGAADDAYFAQGVSDELTSRLTSVAGVRVMSPGSTRQYRNTTKSRDQIGRELGVDYLLDGHVRWDRSDSAARRVRVTVELVRSRDGSSVWADHYEAKTEDLFTVEGTIGERVAAALEVALGERERQTISARPTENFEAYSYFLRGEALRTAEEDALHARRVRSPCTSEPSRSIRSSRSRSRDSRRHMATSTGRTRIGRRSVSRSCAPPRRQRCVSIPTFPRRISRSAYYYFGALRDFDRALAEFSAGCGGSRERASYLGRGRRSCDVRDASWRRWRTSSAPWSSTRALPQLRSISRTSTAPCATTPTPFAISERTLALNPRWAGVYADRAMYLVAWRGDVAGGATGLARRMALPDAGQIIDRFRFHAAMLVGSDPADSAVLRSLTPAFRGDTAQFMVWTADWARRHGEPAAQPNVR